MENLPSYISILFGLTTIATAWIFYKAAGNSKPVLMVILIWLAVQAFIASSGFYTVTDTFPPRFLLLVLPPFLAIAGLFMSPKGRNFIDSLNLKSLTILHTIRIQVEIVLYFLFTSKVIPELMTFEGRNFDVLSGITAPLIFYFAFVKKRFGRKIILIWNVICLGLLINIVINAVLSAPFPFQQFAFNQPNIAVLYFPFIWLPCCVVPLVLLSHLSAIRQLSNNGKKK
ncbi:MAG TPA: hypothetical protein VGE44_03370 [Daejeonella sp.]|uniref:hypothetical protein n=1 Tax=Daejeonella sp. TaxID=2805397 RepID=UPI002ED9C629